MNPKYMLRWVILLVFFSGKKNAQLSVIVQKNMLIAHTQLYLCLKTSNGKDLNWNC